MRLTREQYDSIMLEYSQTRDRHRHELQQRRALVDAKIPEYRALESAVPDLVRTSVKAVLRQSQEPDEPGHAPAAVRRQEASPVPSAAEERSDPVQTGAAREQIRALSRRKAQLLAAAGFPPDYLDMQYDCPDCHDTGYVGSSPCHCLRAKEISILYDQSHLKDLIRTENFRNLSDQWYQGEDLQRFHKAEQTCHSFINSFGRDYENLYFYGTVGTGKSFLSICIAEQILNRGNSVLYFSAASLFDRISSDLFGSRDRTGYRSFCEDLYSCDLLIIDDLGTEFTNSFVSSQLFACLNERHLNRKSTIISTNLSLEELRDRYSDRIFSRITSIYTVCKLTGPDIRILKKIRHPSPSA